MMQMVAGLSWQIRLTLTFLLIYISTDKALSEKFPCSYKVCAGLPHGNFVPWMTVATQARHYG